MKRSFGRVWQTFIVLIVLSVLGAPAWADERREIAGEVEFMSKAYGVQVHHAYSRPSFFPRVWLDKAGYVHGRQIHLNQLQRALPLVQEFLDVYPSNVIKRNLTDIYLLDRLEMMGHPIGGTYAASWLYVVVSQHLSHATVLGTLHHEFSSLLMRNYPFPREQWKQANVSGWEYAGGSRNMIETMESQGEAHNAMGHELFSRGFLTSYGQSCVEDDFNLYASWLFTRKSELDTLASQYPRIRKKRDLCKDFFRSVDTGFDFGE